VTGETGGRELPKASEIGLEKVSVIGVVGLIWVPGAGLATAAVVAPAGNQLTAAGRAVSQVRGAAATHMVPAFAARASVSPLEAGLSA
jgi:hypothetical protein